MNEEIKLTTFSKGGGCGCKIAPAVLQEILKTDHSFPFPNLLIGNETSDDAAVYQLNKTTTIISTSDFFLPIVNDPYDFGRIAAANAISDIYAMGGTPVMAIAILGWPIDKLSPDIAQKVLEGGRAICKEANIPLAGGHTIDSSDPIFGLAVTGISEIKNLKKNNTAREGDMIFLTKPVGVGILSTALKKGLLKEEHYSVMINQMTKLNSIGEKLGKQESVHAMTDVTGFGLLGHLIEMAEGSNLSIDLQYSSVNKVEALDDYLKLKTIPDATFRNWNSYSKQVQFEKASPDDPVGRALNVMEAFNLLPDPQTNGGLLVAVEENSVEAISNLLKENGDDFTVIGKFKSQKEKALFVFP